MTTVSSGSIFLSNFVVHTIIGVYDHEQTQPQPLRLDIEVGLPALAAFESDKLRDTIDYAEVAAFVKAQFLPQRFKLLERCAEHLGHAIVDHFGAAWVDVRVAKLGIIPGVEQAGVRCKVSRGHG
jgi:7,8-dihydroneopterin aldolase/epimerase/oxygenase